MRIHLTSQLLIAGIVTLLFSGCNQNNQQTPKPARDNKGEPEEGWVFKSEEIDISLRLPSRQWKQDPRQGVGARPQFYAYWNGSPMLAAVLSSEKQTREQFKESTKALQMKMESTKGLLIRPKVEEGTNKSGNDYFYVTICEKGRNGFQYVFFAQCYIWTRDKGVTIRSMFEGQGKMTSDVFKAKEYAHFEDAARAILLSVDHASK
jgi:hypothetical protein